MAAWTLQLCRDSNTIAVCTAYEFSGLLARNKGSEWTLSSSEAGVPATGYADPDGGPDDVPFDPRDVTDIRLIANGRVIYAGEVQGDNGGFYAERDEFGERWRWTGVERGWYTLGARLAFPDPASEPPWAGTTHDVRAGLASSVLAGYINENAGGGAIADRIIDGLDVIDEQVGPSLTFSARLTSLADLATRIANDGNFLVIPEHDDDGGITYRLSLARDLSGVIVFSDAGDLLASSARFQQRDATFVLTGGDGEGTARTFRTGTTGATGRDRIETFSDQRNMTSSTEVQADADARLKLAGEKFEITTTLADSITAVALDFGFRVGDKLGIVVRKRRYSAPIEAVEFSVTPERQVVRPRFGAARPNELVELLDQVDHLSGRLDQQIA